MEMAARMPPEQGNRMRTGNCRHIPPEIVEEILLNLPVKSLVRFSFVSKSWNSMISQLEFAKRYRSRAALPGRERMVISLSSGIDVNNAFSCPLSSISDHRIQVATEITCPIQGELFLHAFCDGLWCVEADNSLFLWNPSMRTYKKLPDPSIPAETLFCFVYGIGYDSVGDDYKILRFPRLDSDRVPQTELYSLKSNSWRKIQPLSGYPLTGQEQSVFVNGTLHWISSYLHSGESRIINTFDLSTEKFGEVAQPRYHPISEPSETVEVTVLRGMLCVCLNYRDRFVLWVMEDYGVGKSWTRKFDIQYGNNIPSEPRTQSPLRLTPLYFYDNGDILIKVSVIWSCFMTSEIFIYKIKEDTLQNIIGHDSYSNISDGFLYVESLISPATWPTPAPIARKSE